MFKLLYNAFKRVTKSYLRALKISFSQSGKLENRYQAPGDYVTPAAIRGHTRRWKVTFTLLSCRIPYDERQQSLVKP